MAFYYLTELKEIYKIEWGFTEEEITSEIENIEDFTAMSHLSQWCMHIREYGIHPDSMKIWTKEEIYWPPLQKKLKVYLIKYKYSNYEWKGKVINLEHTGYYIPKDGMGAAFSLMENFDDIYEAYAAYAAYESGEISKGEALKLIKDYLPKKE